MNNDLHDESKSNGATLAKKILKLMGYGFVVLLVLLGGLVALGMVFPPLLLALGMAIFDAPDHFKLPYNGIDFQKIAYIDKQFVMYGIDHDKSGLKQLVIFNSSNGKQWDKSEIKITDDNQQQDISLSGTFNYFKGKCYLIGATVQPLVAPDCKHWQTQAVNSLESNNSYYLHSAHSSAIANNSLYVGGDKGVYKTNDGTTWSKEILPYPTESNPNKFENSFYSMAVGNNKLITETNWWQNKQRRGLIYTKDLTTNKWSYEVYPVPVTNITRGKDRFVAMTESSALMLTDKKVVWNQIKIKTDSSELAYGLNNKFIGINIVNISNDGELWSSLIIHYSGEDDYNPVHIACNDTLCIAVGYQYKIAITANGIVWKIGKFNFKNSKPAWYRRFIN